MTENTFLKVALGTLKVAGWVTGGILTITSIYGLDFYHADERMDYARGVRIKRGFGYMEYGDPDKTDVGILFYPGGKVGLNAYGELLTRVAEKNIFCVVCGMPVNLAILAPNEADKHFKKYSEKYPNIKTWYIGGHSLGGLCACKNAGKRPYRYKGVFFLAAHPDKNDNMNGTGMKALSIYGSIDSVLNRERYEKNRGNFPEDLTEVVIEGGNHGGFGSYGFQNGDHTTKIDKISQIDQTADAISKFCK